MAAPYKLSIFRSGQYLMGEQLYAELAKPQWGENENQTFGELLPILPKLPAKNIRTPDGFYPWFNFDPLDDSTCPPAPAPPDGFWYPDPITGIRAQKGWEVELADGRLLQNIFYDDTFDWTDVVRYRQWKVNARETPTMPNPDYPVVEELRAEAMSDYYQLLREHFILMGSFSGKIKPEPNQELSAWMNIYVNQSILLTPNDNRVRRICSMARIY